MKSLILFTIIAVFGLGSVSCDKAEIVYGTGTEIYTCDTGQIFLFDFTFVAPYVHGVTNNLTSSVEYQYQNENDQSFDELVTILEPGESHNLTGMPHTIIFKSVTYKNN